MHLPINVKSPNNISKWQMGFNSAFKGLTLFLITVMLLDLLWEAGADSKGGGCEGCCLMGCDALQSH
jgi:hypothetical protein